MTIENRIAGIFGLKDDAWLRHANPASVWTRFAILPVFALGVWSRVWIGWYALAPVFAICLWTYVNPRFFAAPKTTDRWASKAVLGEKIWANRDEIEVPSGHKRPVAILTLLQVAGGLVLLVGLFALHFWATLTGLIIVYLSKMWFLDRMVWVFEDMKEHPKYRRLLF